MPKLLDWFLRLDVALWGIALAIGIGVTMALAPTIRNVRLAHPFFALAAIWSLASAFQWLANGGEIKMKYILAFVIGGGIFSAALAAFSWVEANHAEHLAVQNPPEQSSETKTEKKQDDKKQQNKTQSSESQKKDKPKAKPQLTQESHSDNSPNIGTITQGPGSIAQVGGQGNQATVNNFGAPDPTLSWTQEQKQYGSNPPEVLVTLSVDHLLEVPAFAALCDRPCESGLHGDVSIDGMHSEKWLTIDGNPNAVGIELKFPRPLGPGVEVRWRIRSRDQEPIRVKDVQKIPLFALPK